MMKQKMRRLTLVCALIACGIAFYSCGGDNRTKEEHREETALARSFGHEQAMHLANETDTIEMEKVLIDVRVREAALRHRGEDRLADEYIESFLSTLDSVNPSLSQELGARN